MSEKKFSSRDRRKPLIFFVTGAAGTGKTVIIPSLYPLCPKHIVIDMDALYPTLEDWNSIKSSWIYVAYQLYLNRRISIICGMFFPYEFERVDISHLFTPYFIRLCCSDEEIIERLAARGWPEEKIREQQMCNQWIINHEEEFNSKSPLIDTSLISPCEVSTKIAKFIKTTCVKAHRSLYSG
ncbi:AAA family ATPase [Catalinimonas niigatensis]|uniref:AAA family ATPase n=1 Tax=Catalinimonas niigatensis TaxID=1397264 RepID=UPI002665294D|nr:AAA family ATPase [Catalinimonas niigatensis]WPP49813.1 AAA family ATPase [Catalinimonas niigatensis]